MAEHGELLPAGSLDGVRLGVSVSESADLGRLGLLETHLRLALAEVTRTALLSDAGIVYGGHLDPTGYTTFLQAEIEKYSRRDRPLTVCLAWQEHRRLPLLDLTSAESKLSLFGEIVYLDPYGEPIAMNFERGDLAEPVDEPRIREQALTAMREYVTAHTDARLLLGGRRSGFQGRYPGIVEEALLGVIAGTPLFLAAGFGGATLNIARVLGLDPDDRLAHLGTDDALEEALCEGLDEIAASALNSGWSPAANGLTVEENQRLAASYRPSEVASLVAVGLGRLRSVSDN